VRCGTRPSGSGPGQSIRNRRFAGVRQRCPKSRNSKRRRATHARTAYLGVALEIWAEHLEHAQPLRAVLTGLLEAGKRYNQMRHRAGRKLQRAADAAGCHPGAATFRRGAVSVIPAILRPRPEIAGGVIHTEVTTKPPAGDVNTWPSLQWAAFTSARALAAKPASLAHPHCSLTLLPRQAARLPVGFLYCATSLHQSRQLTQTDVEG
jgi:hypothetical protein